MKHGRRDGPCVAMRGHGDAARVGRRRSRCSRSSTEGRVLASFTARRRLDDRNARDAAVRPGRDVRLLRRVAAARPRSGRTRCSLGPTSGRRQVRHADRGATRCRRQRDGRMVKSENARSGERCARLADHLRADRSSSPSRRSKPTTDYYVQRSAADSPRAATCRCGRFCRSAVDDRPGRSRLHVSSDSGDAGDASARRSPARSPEPRRRVLDNPRVLAALFAAAARPHGGPVLAVGPDGGDRAAAADRRPAVRAAAR